MYKERIITNNKGDKEFIVKAPASSFDGDYFMTLTDKSTGKEIFKMDLRYVNDIQEVQTKLLMAVIGNE